MEAFEKIQSNPVSYSIYTALIKYLDTLGKYSVEKKKSSLHIVKERAFLGVHPRSNGLLINIVTDKPIKNGLIHKSEQVSANRYHNEIVVSDTSELNKTVQDWIKEAYQL